MEKEELKKRTTVYLSQPRDYEISGCECGNEDTQWSEYEHHLWCDKCQKDFEPKHDGVFSGPIGIGSSRLLGVYFHRLNLETNEVEAFTSGGYYVKTINFYMGCNFNEEKEIILIKDEKEMNAKLDINSFEIKTNKLIQPSKKLLIYTISHLKEMREWKFQVNLKDNQLKIVEDEEFDVFKKFVLNQKLQQKFPEVNKTKQTKI